MSQSRLSTTLRQEISHQQLSVDADKILYVTNQVLELCGEASQSRSATARIVTSLARCNLSPTIVAPCCPDYGHYNGVYNFNGINGDISLLAQQQIEFLEKLQLILPGMTVQMLYADQEALDPVLCMASQVNTQEFLALVESSAYQTKLAVGKYGWQVGFMSQLVPRFFAEERRYMGLISSPKYSERIRKETFQRVGMYRRLARMGSEEMQQRTIRTAAQYLVLGDYVKSFDGMISNHTTTNLRWYNDAQASVLHNPIAVY